MHNDKVIKKVADALAAGSKVFSSVLNVKKDFRLSCSKRYEKWLQKEKA